MKIAVFTLCVILPSSCICTTSDNYSSVPPSDTSSPTPACDVAVSGNKCGKPDCEGFDKCSILLKNQGDIQKLSKAWMVWKSSASAKSNIQEKICFPGHMDYGCQSSQLKITAQSETEVYSEVWGRNQEKVIYMKQNLSIASEKFHVYTSNVLTVTELDNGSQEVITVKNEQSIKGIFDNFSFGILDTDYESYVVCATKGENPSIFVTVSQQVYASEEMKKQVSQKVGKVLQMNNLSSTTLIEVTTKFDVDVTQYQWDKCSQGGDNNGKDGNQGNGGTTPSDKTPPASPPCSNMNPASPPATSPSPTTPPAGGQTNYGG